jgi:hypothetical protein
MCMDKKIMRSDLISKLSNHAKGLVKNDMMIEEIDPYTLLNQNRFDLPAKFTYARFRELGLKSKWGEQLYDEHIRIFNGYHEPDGSGKRGINAFIKAFNTVLDSIKYNGFDEQKSIIPIGTNNTIIDGAHRLTASVFYGKQIKSVRLNAQPNFDYQYFRNKGLSDKWCDAIAVEYCRLKKNNMYTVVVFPSAIGQNEKVKEILNKYGKIYYEKNIFLNRLGSINLLRQLYLGEKWLGNWKNHFWGARYKAKLCFRSKQPLRAFLIESPEYRNIRIAKEKIRKLFKIGEHSIYINDKDEETNQLAQILFNSNSIHFLNHAKLNYISKSFYTHFDKYKKHLIKQGLDPETCCIVSTAVMGLYGIRKPADLDFLVYGEDILSDGTNFDNHENELQYYLKTKDDIIYNPENYFYFEGIKFASLDVVKEMKNERGTPKDIRDINKINLFLKSSNF